MWHGIIEMTTLANKKAKELLDQLSRLKAQNKKYYDQNKLYFFKPDAPKGKLRQNPLQRELIEAWDNPYYRVFAYTGGNRTGKTTVLAAIAFSTMFGHWPWDNRRLSFPHDGPRKIRIVGQDWEKHIKAVLIPKFKEWWPNDRGVHIKKNTLGIEAFWTDRRTGSTLEIMSNNQDSDLHEGWDGDLVGYDEPPKRDIRVANARGLIDREGKELFSMTLLKEAWVQTEVINARDSKGKPDRTVFAVNGDISVNIGYGITQKGVDQFAKTLTEDEKSARLGGKPSYMSGLVCKKFDRKVHLRDRFKIPLDWIVDIGIDIHPRKEQAILFMATDPKGQRWLFHEIWDHGDGKQVGEWIVRRVNRDSLRVGRVVVDPLAKGDKNNDNTTYDKISAVLYRNGLSLETATKDKDSGILEIGNHLKGPNGEPSIFVFDDLVRTCFEFESWMYDEKTQKPQKINDDMMENLYRLLLLDTVYFPPDDDDDDDYSNRDQVSNVTGY